MHHCHDALLWCIITVMHYRYNASTLWCIKCVMCQCDLLYIMFYWYDVLRCSVMNGWCIVWCSVWWMGDAWVMHEWCAVLWEWMNEWTSEWMNKWACGQCRMTVHFVVFYLYMGLPMGQKLVKSGSTWARLCGTHISETTGWIYPIWSSMELSRPVVVQRHGHWPWPWNFKVKFWK